MHLKKIPGVFFFIYILLHITADFASNNIILVMDDSIFSF